MFILTNSSVADRVQSNITRNLSPKYSCMSWKNFNFRWWAWLGLSLVQ